MGDLLNKFMGTAEQAVLMVHTGLPNGHPPLGNNLASGAANALGNAKKFLGQPGHGKSNDDVKSFVVQYNPSDLRIGGEAEVDGIPSILQKKEGKEGKAEQAAISTPAYAPPKLTLQVRLLFDHTNNAKAFSNVEDYASLNVESIAKDVYGSFFKKAQTVQTEVEALISAMTNDNVSLVTFAWGDFAFSGVLSAVTANYTMFDKDCQPIRAVLDIRIVQAYSKAMLRGWYDDYENAFSGEDVLEAPDEDGMEMNDL